MVLLLSSMSDEMKTSSLVRSQVVVEGELRFCGGWVQPLFVQSLLENFEELLVEYLCSHTESFMELSDPDVPDAVVNQRDYELHLHFKRQEEIVKKELDGGVPKMYEFYRKMMINVNTWYITVIGLQDQREVDRRIVSPEKKEPGKTPELTHSKSEIEYIVLPDESEDCLLYTSPSPRD